MANEKTITLNLAQTILFRKLAEIYYDPKLHEKDEQKPKGAKPMIIDGEKVCKPVHHQLSAILNRADKAKDEREKQEQLNSPKKHNHEKNNSSNPTSYINAGNNIQNSNQPELSLLKKRSGKSQLKPVVHAKSDSSTDMDYPPLLSAKHIMHICSCSRPKAYEIMNQPHRPVWSGTGIKRLHRDIFLAQLEQECKKEKNT